MTTTPAPTPPSIGNTIDNYLQSHSASVASGALSGITTVGEALAAVGSKVRGRKVASDTATYSAQH